MTPTIAAIGCAVVIATLFHLNGDLRGSRTSLALWIPVVWLFIGATRNVTEWLQWKVTMSAGERYLEGSPLDRTVLSALIVIATIVLCMRSRRVRTILRVNGVTLAFFAYCGLTVLWSDYPEVAFKRWIRGVGDLTMVLLILSDRSWPVALERVFTRVGFVVLPMSVLFIRYYPDLGRAYGLDGSLYWTGVAGGKNGLGMMCLIFGTAFSWRLMTAYDSLANNERRNQLTIQSLMVITAIYLLVISDSKTSLGCFIVVSGLIFVTSRFSFARKPRIVNVIVAALVFGCFGVLFLGVGSGALEAMGRDPSLTGRTDIWRVALSYTQNALLGSGYESFWLGDRLSSIARIGGGNQAHNGYIEIYLNLGWVGVAMLLALIVTGYRRIIRGFRRDPQVAVLKLAFFVVAIIYNCTEGAFKMMSPVWITFLLATLALPQARPLDAGSDHHILEPYRRWFDLDGATIAENQTV